MRRAAWLVFVAACGGGGTSSPDARDVALAAGTYMVVDSTCGPAPTTFQLSQNADGSITYAPCMSTCMPNNAPMFDDGTGTFTGSGEASHCGTDPECGCQVNDMVYFSDKLVVETDGSVLVSLGQGGHRFNQCGDIPNPGITLTWCDVHGVLQP